MVSSGEGLITLAVVLKYEGVVKLSGITAALKLSHGFTSSLPLIHNTTRYDIAFSSYEGNIYPGQEVVLSFNIKIMPDAQIKPIVGPLALHFLKSDQRTSTDYMMHQNKINLHLHSISKIILITNIQVHIIISML